MLQYGEIAVSPCAHLLYVNTENSCLGALSLPPPNLPEDGWGWGVVVVVMVVLGIVGVATFQRPVFVQLSFSQTGLV